MSSRSAIHQLRANRARVGSSSQAHNTPYGSSPEPATERGPDGPPLSDFSRGPPRQNRAPSGRRRPSASKSTAANGGEPRHRRSSLLEKLRAATARRPSTSYSKEANREATRKRGPSLVAKAKELMNRRRADTTVEPSFRRLPDQLSRGDEAASGNEKVRLAIESQTCSFDLVQRWKDPADWLTPSEYWKRMHPVMNFRLWSIVLRNPGNHWRLQGVVERDWEAARLLYEQMGGDGGEWWPGHLEEEILDSWAIHFGGDDPPRHAWTLEG